tara:strand:+ start:153331 stop:153828 length:498 start_codon:yes stop_codon:yes gene_type:complete
MSKNLVFKLLLLLSMSFSSAFAMDLTQDAELDDVAYIQSVLKATELELTKNELACKLSLSNNPQASAYKISSKALLLNLISKYVDETSLIQFSNEGYIEEITIEIESEKYLYKIQMNTEYDYRKINSISITKYELINTKYNLGTLEKPHFQDDVSLIFHSIKICE